MAQPDNIHNLFEPRPDEMLAHCEHLFGGYLGGCHDGLVELAWTDTSTRALRHARLYGTDELDELVAHAVTLNSLTGCNVYLGAALRKPGTAPFARAADADFFALTCAYVDLDDPGAATAAKDKYGTAKPTKVVVTGQTPHPRAQLWWRLDEPIVDARLAEGLLKGLATGLNGDHTVVNPSRVMRLAGSVAWPVKDGRVIEMTSLITPNQPLQASYTWGHLARLFPPPQPSAQPHAQTAQTGAQPAYTGAQAAAFTANTADADGVVRKTTVLGMEGEVVDGREAYMLKTISACLAQLMGDFHAVPTLQQLFDLAWPQFCREVDIHKPRANGEPWTAAAFGAKCNYTLKRFEEGKIPGMRTLDEARAIHAQKQAAYEAAGGKGHYHDFSSDFGTQQASGGQGGAQGAQVKVTPYELLDVAQIKALPDPKWLIEGMVVEQALGFIYGPPGCLKTFIALDLTMSLACAQPSWWDKPIQRSGVVIYLTTEGTGSFKFRIMAWEKHRGINADPSLFRMMKTQINFMRMEDVAKLLVTVQYAVDQWGPVAAVVVDTVSRVLPGSDENLQKDMTIFVAACDAVRLRFGVTVIGLHHASRAGNMRGSTVLGAAGDFVLAVDREPGAMTGSVFAEKIKDAEDGWTRPFKVTKIELGSFGTQSSLVVDGTDPEKDDGDDSSWPSRDVCVQILTAIHEQWMAGQPWCWSANSPRCAAKNIIHRWDHIRLAVAEDILNKWHARGVICEETRDAKNHIKGYRKLTDL